MAVADLLDLPLERLVHDALGRDVGGAPPRLEPVPYVSGSPATGALHRLSGTDADGAPWSLFCKVLQHVRHWPTLALLPPEHREHFVAQFPWRAELDLWSQDLQLTLPPGLRPPTMHRLVELPDDRAAVWQEDVAQHPGGGWCLGGGRPDLARYERAAHLLGRWNARSTAPATLAAVGLPPGYALRMYVERSLPLRGLGPLADDALWRHPWLAPHQAVRSALRALAPRIPALLDRLDQLRQCVPHGDASPQNLLVPADDAAGAAELVVIDLSFRSPHALGFDLGQLLVGLTHASELPARWLPDVAARILPAYQDGLRAEGLDEAVDDAREGFAHGVLLRSAFDSLPLHLLDPAHRDDPAARHQVEERLALSAALADLHHALT